MSAPLRCDVAVIGGGAAGLAAAAGAAQAGARTVLVERYGFLGGAATHSSVLSYCGFYTQGEDPLPVVGGIGLMVLTGMARLAVDPRPRRSPTSGNWVIPFDPEAAKVAMDRVAQDTGVHVLLHARMIGARREGKRVTHVQVLDHAGPRVIEAAAFVDASGDANLAHAADGVLVGAGARPRQLASLPVRISGVARDVALDRVALARALAPLGPLGVARLRADGGFINRLPLSDDVWWLGIDIATDGLSAESLTQAEIDGRALAWQALGAMRERLAGFADAVIVATGPQVGIRDSRRARGRDEIRIEDLRQGRLRSDGVACAGWPSEVHDPERGPVYERIGGRGYFHVPLGALQADAIDNLWLAGRVIDCDPVVYGSVRVMGTAFATGHAAGIAAALQAKHGAASAAAVRAALKQQGAIL